MLNNKQRGPFNKPTRKQNPGFWKAVGLCGCESVILKHSFLKHVQHVPFSPIIHSLAACNLVSDHIYTHSHTPLRLLFKPQRRVRDRYRQKTKNGCFLLITSTTIKDTDLRHKSYFTAHIINKSNLNKVCITSSFLKSITSSLPLSASILPK